MITDIVTPKPLHTLDAKKAHQVYKNAAGKRVPGVTTVLGILDKPALIHWAWKLGCEGIDYKKVSQEAADIGTIGHALCECHVKGMELDRSNLNPEYVDKAENAFIKFVQWWDREELEIVESELQLVSEFWQCGGTLDILARRKNKLVLVDMKTSKAIYSEYRVQTSAYASIYEELHDEPIEQVIICRIGKEEAGDFETREVYDRELCVNFFTSLCETYRLRKTIKD